MRRETRRFFWSILLLALVTLAILRPEYIGGYQGFLPSSALPALVNDALVVVWWVTLARILTSGLELFLWSRVFGSGAGGMPRQRKLLTDVLNIIIYGATAAFVAVHVFNQSVTGVFATSSIVAIIIGLALQNSLGDLFAGLALNFERPFKAGDWITLDGSIDGLVLVTNWRATHLRTRNGDEMSVPNAVIARARLTNHALPTKVHRANVDLSLGYGFKANEIAALLKTAAAGVSGVLADPPPYGQVHEMHHEAVVWRLYFFIDDFARLGSLRGHVSQAAYTALQDSSAHAAYLPRHDIWLHKAAPTDG